MNTGSDLNDLILEFSIQSSTQKKENFKVSTKTITSVQIQNDDVLL